MAEAAEDFVGSGANFARQRVISHADELSSWVVMERNTKVRQPRTNFEQRRATKERHKLLVGIQANVLSAATALEWYAIHSLRPSWCVANHGGIRARLSSITLQTSNPTGHAAAADAARAVEHGERAKASANTRANFVPSDALRTLATCCIREGSRPPTNQTIRRSTASLDTTGSPNQKTMNSSFARMTAPSQRATTAKGSAIGVGLSSCTLQLCKVAGHESCRTSA